MRTQLSRGAGSPRRACHSRRRGEPAPAQRCNGRATPWRGATRTKANKGGASRYCGLSYGNATYLRSHLPVFISRTPHLHLSQECCTSRLHLLQFDPAGVMWHNARSPSTLSSRSGSQADSALLLLTSKARYFPSTHCMLRLGSLRIGLRSVRVETPICLQQTNDLYLAVAYTLARG